MQIKAASPEQYLDQLTDERKEVILKLREQILKNIPKGFKEEMSYGMIGYVVPHSMYPKGYHADPKLPLPFINLASQKKHVAVYHMGIYTNKNLLNWFTNEYSKHCSTKLDMGKSCIRFKKMDQIPYKLIGQLAAKITTNDWINIYEKSLKR